MNLEYLDHSAAFACIHVLEGAHPVLLVVHDDGDWVFACGQSHEDDAEQWELVGRGHLTERDPSLIQVLDMADGMEAERDTMAETWIRKPLSTDDE